MVHPRGGSPSALLLLALLLAPGLLLAGAVPASANCNLIPQITASYPSTAGQVERALALPGEGVTIRLDLACQALRPGFARVASENRVRIRFEPPGSGPDTTVEVAGATVGNCGSDPSARCDTLSFLVPDTDALLPPAGDGRGLAGPATILVTDAAGTAVAEIGPLFEPTRSCADRVPAEPFRHFVVLPPATRYAELESGAAAVLATLDGGGNALVPLDFRDVLLADPAAPLFRLLSASALVPAFGGSSAPIQIPSARYVRSFSTSGRPIPPILGALAGGTGVYGSVDAPVSVLRIARVDPDAPSAPPLYDLSDRLLDGRGPIVIAGATAQTRPAAFLSDLAETPYGMVFAVDETIAGTPLNGDGDAVDRVAFTTDFLNPAASGTTTNLGLALTELSPAGRTSLPLAIETALVAFPVSEYRQSSRGSVPVSRNADGDWEDDVLALATTSGSLAPTALAIDPAPVVDGKPLVLSRATAFFRVREGDLYPRVVDRVSELPGGGDASGPSEMRTVRALSHDGNVVAFASAASDLVPGDDNGFTDVFVADRRLGTLVRVPEVPGGEPNRSSEAPALSSDGRWVAYTSTASNLGPGPASPAGSVFVSEVGDGIVPVARLVVGGGVDAQSPDISGDGRHVVFQSRSASLGSGADTNNEFDVFVLDRDRDGNGVYDEPGGFGIERISNDPFGDAANGLSGEARISDDGRFVAFTSFATEYGADGGSQVLVADRDPDGDGRFDEPFETAIERVSVTPAGLPGGGASGAASLSADGRFVAFTSDAPDLVDPPDADEFLDVFVRDRLEGRSERVSLDPDAAPPDSLSAFSSISGDGRFVAFLTTATDLVFPTNAIGVVVVHDRLTDTNEYASADVAGLPVTAGFPTSISLDGRFVAFETSQAVLANDGNGLADVYVRGVAEDFDTDLNGDLERSDTVAAVMSTSGSVWYGPAVSEMSVGARLALALVPERAQGDADLNADGDTRDEVLHLLSPRGVPIVALDVVNSGLAGNRVAFNGLVGCASVPEAAQGPGGGSVLNDDFDREDDVLFAGGRTAWTSGVPVNAGIAVDALLAFGPYCAAAVPELAQELSPLVFRNDDEDATDRLLALAAADGSVFPVGEVVTDFVAEPEGDLLAFRTCEVEDGNDGRVLNQDGDTDDCVMRVLSLPPGTSPPGELIETGYAAIRCDFPACASFFEPFRVRGDLVAFAAREADQSGPDTGRRPDGSVGGVGCLRSSQPGECDLTGDGDALDTVIVTWNRVGRTAQIFEIFEDAPPGSVVPFPTVAGGFREVLRLESDEARIGQDCNGDGDRGDPCVVLVADSDADGVYDESIAGGDNAPHAANPDQADADGDGLGDVVDPNPDSPQPRACDVDRDGDVDRIDVDVIFGDRGMTAAPGDPRDANGDGRVSVADSAFCTEACTRPGCATSSCGLGAELALVLAGVAALRRSRRVR